MQFWSQIAAALNWHLYLLFYLSIALKPRRYAATQVAPALHVRPSERCVPCAGQSRERPSAVRCFQGSALDMFPTTPDILFCALIQSFRASELGIIILPRSVAA